MLTDPQAQTAIDFYKVLNVDPGADAEVIRAAYRALARRDHPDVSSDPAAASKMAELNAAFEVLGHAESRALYDEERRAFAAGVDVQPWRPEEPPAAAPTPAGATIVQPLAERAARARSSTVLEFGRYSGWSLAELAGHDPNYLEWLAHTMIGRPYRTEIEKLLAMSRPRPVSVATPARGRKGLFGRILG